MPGTLPNHAMQACMASHTHSSRKIHSAARSVNAPRATAIRMSLRFLCIRCSWCRRARSPNPLPGSGERENIAICTIRERIRANLNPVYLGTVLRAALVVEHGARSGHGPHTLAFPARVRIVDTAVDQLGVEAQRIRH